MIKGNGTNGNRHGNDVARVACPPHKPTTPVLDLDRGERIVSTLSKKLNCYKYFRGEGFLLKGGMEYYGQVC